jgi:hypothetical protein
MAWSFERDGKRFVALGDLVMPDGVLGYAGSINFSARDVLSSLQKLEALQADLILPGHGPVTSPERYLAAGIAVGRHVGWGKIAPEEPDPRFRLTQPNVSVVAWNRQIGGADFGDFNGDGLCDVAIVRPRDEGSELEFFLNHQGVFDAEPDQGLDTPAREPNELRAVQLDGDGRSDFLVGGQTSLLLVSDGEFPRFTSQEILVGEPHRAYQVDFDGDGQAEWIVAAKFGGFHQLTELRDGRRGSNPLPWPKRGPYVDIAERDFDGDGRIDVVDSYGQLFLRGADRKLPQAPTSQLLLAGEDWSFFALADFNADRRPDLALSSFATNPSRLHVFYHTGRAGEPFAAQPDAVLDLEPLLGMERPPLLRDSMCTADYDGDGVEDLLLARGQDRQIVVFLGGEQGLDARRSVQLALDYRLHHDTRIHAADFDGDGRTDIASLGYVNTGVGASGPLAVYIFHQRR